MTNNNDDINKLSDSASAVRIESKPVCMIVIGMAGTGKTRFFKIIYQNNRLLDISINWFK